MCVQLDAASIGYFSCSKTCLKRPLKNRQKNLILMTNGSLMEVKSIAECSLWSILQYFWPALSDNWSWKPSFGLHFEWPLKTGFTVFNLIFGRKMKLIVFSCVSWGLIIAIWNALKPFSATGLHPRPHTEDPPDPLKSVYSIKCPRNMPGI